MSLVCPVCENTERFILIGPAPTLNPSYMGQISHVFSRYRCGIPTCLFEFVGDTP